jgi:HSP20 family protein
MNIVSCRPIQRGDVFDRLFHSFFSEAPASAGNGTTESPLALDIAEDEKDVIVRASLPGFTKEQVEVELHEGVLSISATQAVTQDETSERFYRRERRYGSVSRRIALPEVAADGEASAELKDGVLTVRVPRAKPEVARKVRIN